MERSELIKPAIKKLEIITRGLVSSHVVGRYKSVFKGKGLEFDEYRPYTPQDDVRSIDWKASVRTKELLVKDYEEERNLNVFMLINVGSSMVYSSADNPLKNEYAAQIAASLAYAILNAEDAVGFATFNHNIVRASPPSIGDKQFYILSKVLVDSSLYGGGCNLAKALRFTLSYLKAFSVVIIISDFIGLKGEWERYLRMASRKFDVIGIMVKDPLDVELPMTDKQIVVQDPYSDKQLVIQPSSIRNSYNKYAKQHEKIISDIFMKIGGGFTSLTTDKDFVKPILELFKRRIKRWR